MIDIFSYLWDTKEEFLSAYGFASEKDFVEARLANIYNMLRDLKVKTNSIKEEIKNLEIALENYETISNRINELENELNNK